MTAHITSRPISATPLHRRIAAVLVVAVLCLTAIPVVSRSGVRAITNPTHTSYSIRSGSVAVTNLTIQQTYRFSVIVTAGSGSLTTTTWEWEDAVGSYDIKYTYTYSGSTFAETTDTYNHATKGSCVESGSGPYNVTFVLTFTGYTGASIDVTTVLKDVRLKSDASDGGTKTDVYTDVFQVYGGASPSNTRAVLITDTTGSPTTTITIGHRYAFTITVTAGLQNPPDLTTLELEVTSGSYPVAFGYTYGTHIFDDRSSSSGIVVLKTSDSTYSGSSVYLTTFVVDIVSWPGVSPGTTSGYFGVTIVTTTTGCGSDTDTVANVFRVQNPAGGGGGNGTPTPTIPGIPLVVVACIAIAVIAVAAVLKRRR